MIMQFWLKLKSQRYLLPLLLVVVVMQLAMAHVSSYVLADRQPPLSLAVQQLAFDDTSNELVLDLGATNSFQVINVEANLSKDRVFGSEDVQGLLVIPADFGENINNGQRTSVIFYPAPGVTNIDFAAEQIAGVVTQLKARHSLSEALASIGADDNAYESAQTIDLLDVVYDGPLLQNTPTGAALIYSVAALLILLAFLHSALTVPTREDKRLLMHGRSSFIRQLALSQLVVWLIWILIITLFFSLVTAFTGIALDTMTLIGFVAIMFYCSSLAAVLAQFLGRHAASWVFLPIFLLSMTLGGGLWNNLVVSQLLSPLIPVAAISATDGSSLMGIIMLFAASITLLAAMFITPRFLVNKRKTSQ